MNFWNSIFGTTFPTVDYCEVATDGLIARPGYFISNFAYIFLGIYLITRKDKFSRLFGILSILVGTFSAIYDASFRFNAQILDLMAMFSIITYLLIINLMKIETLKDRKRQVAFFIVSLLTYFILISTIQGVSGRIFFGVYVVLIILTEFLYYRRNRHNQFKFFLLALALFVIGFLIWSLDASKTYCFPSDLFQGRAIYHYLTAGSLYFLYKHHRMVLG